MTEFRFLHTSDLHLGKRFGNFPEEPRSELVLARATLPERLAAAARSVGAGHILVAGDTFDTETPSERVVRQALTAMGADAALHWWLIPGNHDSLSAEPLWQGVVEHAPANVHVLTSAAPVDIAQGVTLLPAPATRRFPGIDLTAWMDGCETPEGHLRIGLGHGGVLEFGSDEGSSETISPNRAELARLDYLALGDWHGRWRLNDLSHYSGTPEHDRFKHEGRGSCLAVTLTAPGGAPMIEEIQIGRLDWRQRLIALTPGANAAAALEALLPADRLTWRETLMKLTLSGWVRLSERQELMEAIARIRPEFCHFDLVEDQLQTEYSPGDLDAIARGGALRLAADELHAAAADPDASKRDRDVAEAALNRLYGFVKGSAA
ncbi:metallophosphoesterase [Tropicimonas sp. IMCC34043]|uniref:metallophosphoesterase family protein n=1 Tax=Tropicimonas sp. IMCC34043 TaxID=2248760 RepID=UPI000E26AC86|nr:metallophosphoesterase [Tropicimonas sp. IMCC34043]